MRIIKCIVDIFVVDISFNQLSGLCALCFFEEVIFFYTSSQLSTIFLIFQRSLTNYLFFQISALISHDHLFKRSIILIKAWCYYESRILGSNHGLISTYALEILVLYIFNLYNNRFSGPLEVTNLFFFGIYVNVAYEEEKEIYVTFAAHLRYSIDFWTSSVNLTGKLIALA